MKAASGFVKPYYDRASTLSARSRAEIARFFSGCDLVEPGIWRAFLTGEMDTPSRSKTGLSAMPASVKNDERPRHDNRMHEDVEHRRILRLPLASSNLGTGAVTAVRQDFAVLHQAALSAVMQVGTDLRTEMMLADSPNYAGNPWRVFRGTAEQIRLVRTFVKIVFAGHRAVDDAVLVASEITTNSVDHSLSGMPGGLFLVHLARFSAYSVGIMVTDEGGTAQPARKRSGR